MKMEKSSAELNELKIIFIYDRFSCRREVDDPKEAILYFHPSSISVEKRVAICGQLMGVTHFFSDTFKPPRILTLANGKFALRNFDDQYVLAIGCSSVTSDWLLEKEADILESVIKFFHCDIKTILRNSNYDRDLVSVKLTSMMDHYIPISQHHGDLFSLTFGILPILYLPKSASNISLQASVLLQTCLLKNGVLGGIVMHQNKVVGVEVGPGLAQKLAFIQPYRMPPADLVKLDFKLPIGVQIFRVYITDSELQELNNDSSKFQHPESFNGHQSMSSKAKKGEQRNVMETPIEEEKDEPIPKSVRSNSDASSGIHSDETQPDSRLHSAQNDPVFTSSKVSDFRNETGNSGTKFRPRRCQSVVDLHYDIDLEDESSEQKGSSPLPPLTDCLNKKFGASVADPTFPYFSSDGRLSVSGSFHHSNSTESSEDDQKKSRNDDSSVEQEKETPFPPTASTPLVSKPELTPSSVRRPIDLPLRHPNKLSRPQQLKKKLWATFNELISPVEPAEPLFENLVNGDQTKADLRNLNAKARNGNATFPADDDKLKHNESKGEPDNPNGRIPESIHLRLVNSFRRLSSHEELLDDGRERDADSSSSYSASTCSETEKLDLHSSSSSSLSQTSRIFSMPKILNSRLKGVVPDAAGKRQQVHPKNNAKEESPRQEVALYIYYDGSMRLLLLLNPQVETNEDLIESLWEYVSASLIQLKQSLSKVEEQSSFSSQSDPYCFLRYESIWKSLAYGGRNESMDFNTVQFMHRDFTRNPNINELIIRGDDHVVYGYQCVGSEVYYQQRAGLQPGLPMPSDLMGKLPLKAKRRLERDHSIILL